MKCAWTVHHGCIGSTFIVLALLILIMSPVVIMRTPTDIFPSIGIPVIAVAWQFTGLNYLQVITAQTVALTSQRNEIDILRRRIGASVLLVKALGGDWSVAELPAP